MSEYQLELKQIVDYRKPLRQALFLYIREYISPRHFLRRQILRLFCRW